MSKRKLIQHQRKPQVVSSQLSELITEKIKGNAVQSPVLNSIVQSVCN